MSYSRYGYGSHSFIYDYIRQNRCKKIMEIGIADGENARKMVTAANENFLTEEIEYYGFDIFRWYNWDSDSQIQLVSQKLSVAGCQFKLFKGDSVKTLPKILHKLPMMDLIFIDGGHSYSTVKSDWENSKTLMHEKTAVFFHNYDFSGPNRLVNNISRDKYCVEIIDVPYDSRTAFVKQKT